MVERIRRHLTDNAIAYLALFFALSGSAYAAVKVGSGQVADNSLPERDIRDHSIKGVDVAKGTLRAQNFHKGVLPAGAGAGTAGGAGTPGPPGPRGPSFGDGRQVGNVATLACPGATVVGTQNVTVAQPSRIWVHAQATINDNNSVANEFGLFLLLRNAADTATLAATPSLTDRDDTGNGHHQLSPGGILLTWDGPVQRPRLRGAAGHLHPAARRGDRRPLVRRRPVPELRLEQWQLDGLPPGRNG